MRKGWGGKVGRIRVSKGEQAFKGEEGRNNSCRATSVVPPPSHLQHPRVNQRLHTTRQQVLSRVNTSLCPHDHLLASHLQHPLVDQRLYSSRATGVVRCACSTLPPRPPAPAVHGAFLRQGQRVVATARHLESEKRATGRGGKGGHKSRTGSTGSPVKGGG